jgi:signal transduction histidine kinase
VQIRVRKQPEQLRISVVDGGEGLSAEARRRMFEWYFTTKKHGTGMGLAICRSIVEAHGGRVWAEDGRPRGTRLEVSLPIGRGDRI